MDFKISNSYLSIKTSGDIDIIDITSHMPSKAAESGLTEGHVLIFVPGSTAAVTTIEYEKILHSEVFDEKERSEKVLRACTG